MPAKLLIPPKFRAFDSNGDPLAGGKLYSYQAGSSIPQVTYTDETGGTPNANPTILDANGEANVWIGSADYKLVLKDSNDVVQWTVDQVNGNLTAATDGIDGKSVRNGSGAPGGGTGNDGDFYIDTTSWVIYGPKASGVWGSGTSILSMINVENSYASPYAVVAGTSIPFVAGTRRIKKYIQGSGGAVTMTANPVIQAGTVDGQELMLVGCSDTNTVFMNTSNGIDTRGDLMLGAGDVAVFNWDNGSLIWRLVSRSS